MSLRRALAFATCLLFVASCGNEEDSPNPPTVVLNSPAGPLTATDTFQFNATVNGASGTAVFWSLPEGATAGTISLSGLYTAGVTPGTYHVVATTSSDPAGADTAVVQVILHIEILGSTTPMGTVMARQFTAALIGTASQVIWSLPEGATAGTIDSTGVYISGTTPGTYRIVATTATVPASADTISVAVLPDPATPVFNAHADSLDPFGPDPSFSIVPVAGLTYAWSVYGATPLTRTDSTGIKVDLAENSAEVYLGVTATNAAGRYTTGVDTVRIIKRLIALPVASYGVAISPSNVLAAFGWSVDKVELRSGSDTTLLHSVDSPGTPVHGAFSGNGATLFVVNQNGGSVARITAASGAITTVAYDRQLYNIAVATDSSAIYVTGPDGWVFKSSPATLARQDSVYLGSPSNGLAVRSGQLWVGTFSGHLVRLDPVTLDVVDSVVVPGALIQRIALNADASTLYAADEGVGRLIVVNTATKAVTAVSLGIAANGIALTPDGAEVWVGGFDGRIHRLATAGFARLGYISTGDYVRNIAISADGTLVLVGHENGTALIRR